MESGRCEESIRVRVRVQSLPLNPDYAYDFVIYSDSASPHARSIRRQYR